MSEAKREHGHATTVDPAEVAALKGERDAAAAEAKRLSSVVENKEAAIGAVLGDAATLRAENERLRELLREIEANDFWARSHTALRAKINAALGDTP